MSSTAGGALPPLRPVHTQDRPNSGVRPGWSPGRTARLLARSRPLRLIPGRPVYLRASWLTAVDPDGGPITVTIETAN